MLGARRRQAGRAPSCSAHRSFRYEMPCSAPSSGWASVSAARLLPPNTSSCWRSSCSTALWPSLAEGAASAVAATRCRHASDVKSHTCVELCLLLLRLSMPPKTSIESPATSMEAAPRQPTAARRLCPLPTRAQ